MRRRAPPHNRLPAQARGRRTRIRNFSGVHFDYRRHGPDRPRRRPGMNARPRRHRNPVHEVPVPPECRQMIRQGALVSISTSGGKDSQTMTILLARIVPRDQLVAVHAPLGEVEWPGTIDHILATLPEGVPLILAPVASGKTLLNRVEERRMYRRLPEVRRPLRRQPVKLPGLNTGAIGPRARPARQGADTHGRSRQRHARAPDLAGQGT